MPSTSSAHGGGGGATVKNRLSITGTQALTLATHGTALGKAPVINAIYDERAADKQFQGINLPDASGLTEGDMFFFSGTSQFQLPVRTDAGSGNDRLVGWFAGDCNGYCMYVDADGSDGQWLMGGPGWMGYPMTAGSWVMDRANFTVGPTTHGALDALIVQGDAWTFLSNVVVIPDMTNSNKTCTLRVFNIDTTNHNMKKGSLASSVALFDTSGGTDGEMSANDTVAVNTMRFVNLTDSLFVVGGLEGVSGQPVFIAVSRSGTSTTLTPGDPVELTTGDAANRPGSFSATMDFIRTSDTTFRLTWPSSGEVYSISASISGNTITWGTQENPYEWDNINNGKTYLVPVNQQPTAFLGTGGFANGAGTGVTTNDTVVLMTDSGSALTNVEYDSGPAASGNWFYPIYGPHYPNAVIESSTAFWRFITATASGIQATGARRGNPWITIGSINANVFSTGRALVINDMVFYYNTYVACMPFCDVMATPLYSLNARPRGGYLNYHPDAGASSRPRACFDIEDVHAKQFSICATMFTDAATRVGVQFHEIPTGKFEKVAA
jgi:hypothetical protein